MTTTTDRNKIGKYAIVREIAQGGFGRTLLAENPEGKRVVLKQFNPQQHNISSQALRLFDQECELLKKIGHHDQIPSFIDYFEENDERFIAQEFIPGKTLKEELDESGTFNERQIVDLLMDILPVIQFIHQNKVIHRDIKPENIIRRSSDQKLVLVDFGASKPLETTVVAETGTSIGSAKFISPEQARGKATYASDIYSLGLTCANLLTYASPFEFEDIETGNLVWRNFCDQPVTEGLGLIIDKMLERGLRDRYGKASQVLEALTELQEQGKENLLDPEAIFPWEQQENEPDAWFKRFEIFLHMTSEERDVPTAYFRIDKVDNDSSLEEWITFANRFHWETRADAYDESAIGSFLKHVKEGDKPGPLSRAIWPIAGVVALMVGVTIISLDSPQVGQESPDPVAIEQPAQEPEGGILPRVPMLDDLKDELVADFGTSPGLAQGINSMFFIMKIMLILMFFGAFVSGVGMAARLMIYSERN